MGRRKHYDGRSGLPLVDVPATGCEDCQMALVCKAIVGSGALLPCQPVNAQVVWNLFEEGMAWTERATIAIGQRDFTLGRDGRWHEQRGVEKRVAGMALGGVVTTLNMDGRGV